MFCKSNKLTAMVAVALVAMAATFVGCSNDETVDQQASASICFSPLIDKSISTTGTRSVAPLTSDNFSEFTMWAFKNDVAGDDGFVMGHDATTGYVFRKSSNNGNNIDNPAVWGYANNAEVTFWPSGCQQLQFYGLHPTTASGLEINMTKANHNFTYEVPETGTDHSAQRDIIATAVTTNLSAISAKGNTQMMVPLTFQHILSQIVFEAALEENVPQFEVTIRSMMLCNIYKKGVCTLNTPADAGTSVATWSLAGQSKDSYSLDFGSGVTLSTASTTAVALTSQEGGDNLMVIPQQITAWDPANSITANDTGDKGTYLKINCRIRQNGINLLSNSEEFVDIYAPLAGVNHSDQSTWDGLWKAGVKYKYTLTFGLGYNANGAQNGLPIRFTVTTTDWETGTASNVQL